MVLIQILLLLIPSLHAAEPPIQKLKVNPKYRLSIYAFPIENARSMTQGPDGIIFVGTRHEGKVYAVMPDKNGDGRADDVITIAKDLNDPNGVAFRDGDLYVAEPKRLLRFKQITKDLRKAKGQPWGPKFPANGEHDWKYIAFGPDGWLYVPIGAPCNICNENPKLFAALHRISADGSKMELVASGIRNTVGFDWSIDDKSLWFTDNGRDWMGDDQPACELNRVSKTGQNFGFPFCHGKSTLDPEFGKGKNCADYVPPAFEFPAHSSPLGMKFIKSIALKGSVLVAEHGSWNRTSRIGYQVTQVTLKGDKAEKSEPFLTGFLENGSAWGRPVDILEMPDGSILISDDKAGAIYRASPVKN